MTQFNFPLSLYELILSRHESEQRWLFDFAAMYGLGKLPKGFDMLTDTEREIMAILDRVNSTGRYGEEIKEIVTHLNKVCGTAFRANTPNTVKHLTARFSKGYTVADIKAVIDHKAKAWKNDPHMAPYLRPDTLFGTKFEGYHCEVLAMRIREGERRADVSHPGSFDTDDFFAAATARANAAIGGKHE